MSTVVRVPGVVLRGADLNFTASPWSAVNRANNLRIFTAGVAMVAAIVIMGFFDAGSAQIAAVGGVLVFGWLVFIWQSNGPLMDAYRAAYVETPVGRPGCDFEFDEAGMKQSGPGYTVVFAWDMFVEVVDDQTGFMLWMTPFSAVKLPIRFLDDEGVAALRVLIQQARERGLIKGVPPG